MNTPLQKRYDEEIGWIENYSTENIHDKIDKTINFLQKLYYELGKRKE